ncbi:MAG TPA: ribosome small subunit-dependent GTPase A [Steroidobacteraceae bacterium]|jgi:ribosome biogenesis GTPase|nr:ribosome small subunit-dependent GTPase A [Steroidobacteraceae bacterium]
MQQTLTGRVLATFGRHMLVRAAGGAELRARAFGRDLGAVCGDEVRCRIDPHHDEVHAIEVLPRRNALWRSNARGGAEAVVANLTRLLVVLAPLPVPDLFVVDRYLAAATAAGIAATLVLNKSDLPLSDALAAELAAYAQAGFTPLHCSAASAAGIEQLRAVLLPGTTAALVGQSGVGKSSLVRRLAPQAQVTVAGLASTAEGRHTTSAARTFDLPDGAALIDSPGVRDFSPAVEALDERTLGFPEVAQLAPGCRFSDCRHLREPQCAVRAAAASGAWHPRRYESYRRLRRLHAELRSARPPGRRRGQPGRDSY